MKTIQDIRNEINIKDLQNELDTNESYEDVTIEEMIGFEVSNQVRRMIQNVSESVTSRNGRTFGGVALSNYNFKITNEEVLNTLRQLYILSNNKFVKEVISTVGKSRFFTENQLRVINEEIEKFNKITLNF